MRVVKIKCVDGSQYTFRNPDKLQINDKFINIYATSDVFIKFPWRNVIQYRLFDGNAQITNLPQNSKV